MKIFQAAININPQLTYAYGNRCNAYFLQEKYNQALTDCDKALELAPNTAPFYVFRGNVHNALGETQTAIADYQQAAELFKAQDKPQSAEKVENILGKITIRQRFTRPQESALNNSIITDKTDEHRQCSVR